MSDPGNLQPPAHWHDMSEREQQLFEKLEFRAKVLQSLFFGL